ncbi:hypothetical protein LIER_07483 [Lithospermum erythrorhizon]|uniref:Uncharacterized protein n=1 Tax=Lithospermum erythrorhizon TaxID=34254 RepID=A0AAV3P8I9_LITER
MRSPRTQKEAQRLTGRIAALTRSYPYTDGFSVLGHVKVDFKIDERKERLIRYLRRVRKLANFFSFVTWSMFSGRESRREIGYVSSPRMDFGCFPRHSGGMGRRGSLPDQRGDEQ